MHPPTDHWNRQTIRFLQPYLKNTHHSLDIATGYFTIAGFGTLRKHFDQVGGKHPTKHVQDKSNFPGISSANFVNLVSAMTSSTRFSQR